MRIVVEGFDGTGKSTLIRLLETATGWTSSQTSPSPPSCPAELMQRNRNAINTSMVRPDVLFDRWPFISEHCYGQWAQCLNQIDNSLRVAGIDRIIHCDVARIRELKITPRENDKMDALQTARVALHAEEILIRYRLLMDKLRGLGYDVRRYEMIHGVLC